EARRFAFRLTVRQTQGAGNRGVQGGLEDWLPSRLSSPAHHAQGGGSDLLLQIDSASAYRNQGPSAASIPASGIARPDIFFTTKVPVREFPLGYDNTHKLVDTALSETGLDYPDLVLIHS